jgi:hypothetical protein
MEIFKILDRFELLYPNDERFADLRRAYIDKDLHSMFKLAGADEDLRKAVSDKNIHSLFRIIGDTQIQGSVDDLRKAVVDQNLYSIFRLLPPKFDDLKKSMCEENIHSIYRILDAEWLGKIIEYDNYWVLFDILQDYSNSEFVNALKYMYNENIEFDEDCLSRGQLKSKLWLIDELKKTSVDLGVVFLCAGWYGTLATLMFENKLLFEKIRSFDVDPSTEKIAEIFNSKWVIDGWKFKPVVQDIRDIDFEEHCYTVSKANNQFEALWDRPDTIINTSCEHIQNFEQWYAKIPKEKLVVMQCNNFKEVEEHVNTHDTLESFARQTPMTIELYSGELDLGKYKRFMRIGYR